MTRSACLRWHSACTNRSRKWAQIQAMCPSPVAGEVLQRYAWSEGVDDTRDGRAEHHYKDRGQNQKRHRKEHLDGGLLGQALRPLATAHAHLSRLDAQHASDAGAQLLRLDDSAYKLPEILDACAIHQFTQGIAPRHAQTH